MTVNEEKKLAEAEAKYTKWLRDLCSILKCPMMEEGCEAEDAAYKLYSEGSTPEEAAVLLNG